jgi:hypothetical protein
MDKKIKSYYISFVVISTALLLTYSGTTQFPDATAQNVTTAANQTGATAANQTAAPGQNQTASPFGNLTTAWLDPLRGSFSSVRESLHSNDTLGAYESLGLADIQLFAIVSDPATGTQVTTLEEQFSPLNDRIGSAQDALRANDVNKALDELNAIDLELLRLNQQLPPGEPEEEE